MRKNVMFAGLTLVLASGAMAHKGKKHVSAAAPSVEESREGGPGTGKILDRIKGRYIQEVKPIFKTKCFDCHATAERLPWYARIPGPKQLIRHDIRDARKHLDMRKDFPFGGHGSPLENLEAIEKTLADGSMPPLRYRIMHWDSVLSEEEKTRIRDWLEAGRKLLRSKASGKSKGRDH